MDELATDELGQQLLPATALRPLDDLARERLVGLEETLRQPEQRGPELVFDFRAAARMLDVLADQRAALRARLGIDVKDGPKPLRRPVRASARRAFQLADDVRMDRERIRAGERCQPALGCLDIRQRILARLAKTEHRASPSVTCRLETACCQRHGRRPFRAKDAAPAARGVSVDSGCKFRTDVRRVARPRPSARPDDGTHPA